MRIKTNYSKLVILDIHLRNLGGHGYSYDTQVAKSAKKYFSKTIIYHHPSFYPPKKDKNFKKLSCLLYYSKLEDINKNKIQSEQTKNNYFGTKFIKEIKFIYKLINAIFYTVVALIKEYKFNCRFNILFQHPFIEDIFAVFIISNITKIIPFLKIKFSLVLRNTIKDITEENKNKSYIFKFLESSKNIDLYTDSDLLTKNYKQFFIKKNVLTLPMPTPRMKLNLKYSSKKNSQFNIGILGPPRSDKGFLLLPTIIKNFIINFKDFSINFLIQIDSNMSTEIKNAYIEIVNLSKGNLNNMININFLKGPLSENEYQSKFLIMDAVLILYNHPRYKYSTSGIFVESLIFKVPTICWDNTWPAFIIKQAKEKKLRIGECVTNIEEILEKTKTLYAEFKLYKKDLNCFKLFWQEVNDFDNVARYLYKSTKS